MVELLVGFLWVLLGFTFAFFVHNMHPSGSTTRLGVLKLYVVCIIFGPFILVGLGLYFFWGWLCE